MAQRKIYQRKMENTRTNLPIKNQPLPDAFQIEARQRIRDQVQEINKLDSLVGKAFQHHQQGKLKDAVALYEAALENDPNHFDALHLLGTACLQDKQYLNAITFFSRALQVNSEDAACLNHLGVALGKINLQEQAIVSFNKAIELEPKEPTAYSNRGLAYAALSRFERALLDYKKAIDLSPSFLQAHMNRGVALRELNNLDAALKSYDHASMISSDDPQINLNKAMVLILKGDFKQGWPLYESRWEVGETVRANNAKREFSRPLWLGQTPLQGKTILIHAEQGFGDTIQFCRYASLADKRGARVILEVQPSLVHLLKGLAGVSQIVCKGDKLPDFDFHCPMLSLPLAFGTEVDTIPPITLTLSHHSKRLEKWQSILGPKTKPRVGLTWSGSPTHRNDRNRSLELSDLITYLPKEFQYVSLQKDLRNHDLQVLDNPDQLHDGKALWHFGHLIGDFADTAALCHSMDLIISVDTSVAHLAATLQKPTWILLPFAPDWRWLIEDPDSSPWYPTAKLIRQTHKGNWKGPLTLIEKELVRWLRNTPDPGD